MKRRRLPIALLTGGLMIGLVSACEPAPPDPGPGPSGPTGPTPAPTSQFALDWAKPVTNQGNISTSSPVVVDNGGSPFVVTGDLGGYLRAFRLSDGAPVAGWSNVNVGAEIKAPLSSDGSNVYVPVGQNGIYNVPKFKKYRADGTLVWDTNPGAAPPPAGSVFLLAGMSLARVNGQMKAFGASSGHDFYGFDAGTGTKEWSFRNGDSTMATPATADLYGSGQPQVILSNDRTGVNDTGGHLRIFTAGGRQICSADQRATGDTYKSSGYNNSSPAVAEIGGRPLIVFGSTGPTQVGVGGNQVVAYDANCGRRWASPPLAGQAMASPTFADVMGTGTPQVIQVVQALDGAKRYPRVYVIDAGNGQIVSDTGPTLRGYGGSSLLYTSASSIVTADMNGDGREELFVPALGLLVLDGRTRTVMQSIDLGGSVTQATPVITQESGGRVRVTIAGYSGNNGNGVYGSTIRSYTAASGALTARGWPRFGHDSQLTGRSGAMSGPYDTLIEGQTLPSGAIVRADSGGSTLRMQADGNLVIYDGQIVARWQSATSTPGSVLTVAVNGQLQVRAPSGTVLWQSPGVGGGFERARLGADSVLRVSSATLQGVEQTSSDTVIWQTG